MHLFVSDIHMTDQETGSPVSDMELQQLAAEVGNLAEREPVTLVLLGDIIDFLRSKKWAEVWDASRSAPWSAMSPRFKNFCNNHPEACALEIAQEVAKRYSRFSADLRKLVDSRRLTVVYLPGNHDFMVQLSSRLRKTVREFLSLSNDPEKPFPTVYQDEAASVYATHGNSFDPINWHRMEEGYWAFGDAIVIRIVNRFAAEAAKAIGCAETADIAQQMHELDNIEPQTDIPVFVLWLMEEFLTSARDKKMVLDVWKGIVGDFLELQPFANQTAYKGPAFFALRNGLEISTHLTLAKFIGQYASLLPQTSVHYQKEAERLARTLRKYRFIVFGHTHDPMIVPVACKVKGKQAFYVNTGSWRKVVARPSPQVSGPFVGTQVNGLFIVDGSAKYPPSGRYHLIQRWHAN